MLEYLYKGFFPFEIRLNKIEYLQHKSRICFEEFIKNPHKNEILDLFITVLKAYPVNTIFIFHKNSIILVHNLKGICLVFTNKQSKHEQQ